MSQHPLLRLRYFYAAVLSLFQVFVLSAGDLPPRGWTIGPSVGVHWGNAYEIVYDTSGVPNQNEYLSLLIWDLNPAVMAGVESRWESGDALGLDLRLRSAIPGMPVGEMHDYDWLYTDWDWSHWSVSDVNQRFGFTLDAVADWHLVKRQGFRLRLGVGYHLDWWAWTDIVKDSIYSSTTIGEDYPVAWADRYPGDDFRDTEMSLSNYGQNGINYNAAYHVPLVSLTAVMEQKVFFLRFNGRIGPVIAMSHDTHVFRNLDFYDSAFGGPWLDASLETGFRTAGRFSFTLRGEYAWLNETRGNSVVDDGSTLWSVPDSAGFSFRRIGVSVLCSWTLDSAAPDEP